MDPWWWSDSRGPGLIVRLDYLDRFLAEREEALVILEHVQVSPIQAGLPG